MLIVVALVISDFVTGRRFSELCPESSTWDICMIISVTTEETYEITLGGEDIAMLLDVLEEPKYYKDGPASAVMEGRIYHLIFQGEEAQARDLLISDTGTLYIDSYRYNLRPDTVSAYLYSIVDSAAAGQ